MLPSAARRVAQASRPLRRPDARRTYRGDSPHTPEGAAPCCQERRSGIGSPRRRSEAKRPGVVREVTRRLREIADQLAYRSGRKLNRGSGVRGDRSECGTGCHSSGGRGHLKFGSDGVHYVSPKKGCVLNVAGSIADAPAPCQPERPCCQTLSRQRHKTRVTSASWRRSYPINEPST